MTIATLPAGMFAGTPVGAPAQVGMPKKPPVAVVASAVAVPFATTFPAAPVPASAPPLNRMCPPFPFVVPPSPDCNVTLPPAVLAANAAALGNIAPPS